MPAHAGEPRRILYGTSTSIGHLPVWVGKDTGLFAKNGLNVEPVQIRGGAVSTMAIMSGQSVLASVGAGSVVRLVLKGEISSCLLVRLIWNQCISSHAQKLSLQKTSRGKRPESRV